MCGHGIDIDLTRFCHAMRTKCPSTDTAQQKQRFTPGSQGTTRTIQSLPDLVMCVARVATKLAGSMGDRAPAPPLPVELVASDPRESDHLRRPASGRRRTARDGGEPRYVTVPEIIHPWVRQVGRLDGKASAGRLYLAPHRHTSLPDAARVEPSGRCTRNHSLVGECSQRPRAQQVLIHMFRGLAAASARPALTAMGWDSKICDRLDFHPIGLNLPFAMCHVWRSDLPIMACHRGDKAV